MMESVYDDDEYHGHSPSKTGMPGTHGIKQSSAGFKSNDCVKRLSLGDEINGRHSKPLMA